MNKLINKVLRFANQLAADHYKREEKGTGVSKKGSNVVDIKSRAKKDRTSEGMADYTGGSGL